jgi:hypothetical protein
VRRGALVAQLGVDLVRVDPRPHPRREAAVGVERDPLFLCQLGGVVFVSWAAGVSVDDGCAQRRGEGGEGSYRRYIIGCPPTSRPTPASSSASTRSTIVSTCPAVSALNISGQEQGRRR